ncbi:hypothetical protein [Streptomyces sp. NRRL S-1022]|uniref:hypothetical protein n=1 Tax=Streptomyces sp. NRRL S-1022 TaxID=1463880 RepID=UPI0004C18BFA
MLILTCGNSHGTGDIIGGGIFALPATVARYGTVSLLAFAVLSVAAPIALNRTAGPDTTFRVLVLITAFTGCVPYPLSAAARSYRPALARAPGSARPAPPVTSPSPRCPSPSPSD